MAKFVSGESWCSAVQMKGEEWQVDAEPRQGFVNEPRVANLC